MSSGIRIAISEKYKVIAFFVVAIVLATGLIINVVYKASRELEITYEINHLYQFYHFLLNKQIDKRDLKVSRILYRRLEDFLDDNYYLYRLDNNKIINTRTNQLQISPQINAQTLEKTRLNEHGGYLKQEGNIYTWVMLPMTEDSDRLLLLHKYKEVDTGLLANVYSRYFIIPMLVFMWFMVWGVLVLRYMQNRIIKQRESLEYVAMHDVLTGLPNRDLFDDRLNHLIKMSRREEVKFALVFIEMNNFKALNDSLGYEYGDELLRQVAQRITNTLRDSDTSARIAGDEFSLLVRNVNESILTNVCNQVDAALKEPYVLFGSNVTIRFSMGVATYPTNGVDSKTLTRNADHAMRDAGVNGGGIQFCKERVEHKHKNKNNVIEMIRK